MAFNRNSFFFLSSFLFRLPFLFLFFYFINKRFSSFIFFFLNKFLSFIFASFFDVNLTLLYTHLFYFFLFFCWIWLCFIILISLPTKYNLVLYLSNDYFWKFVFFDVKKKKREKKITRKYYVAIRWRRRTVTCSNADVNVSPFGNCLLLKRFLFNILFIKTIQCRLINFLNKKTLSFRLRHGE